LFKLLFIFENPDETPNQQVKYPLKTFSGFLVYVLCLRSAN